MLSRFETKGRTLKVRRRMDSTEQGKRRIANTKGRNFVSVSDSKCDMPVHRKGPEGFDNPLGNDYLEGGQSWTCTESILLGIAWERFRQVDYKVGTELFWSNVAKCFPHRRAVEVERYFWAYADAQGPHFEVPCRAMPAARKVAKVILRGGSWYAIQQATLWQRNTNRELRGKIGHIFQGSEICTATECILLGVSHSSHLDTNCVASSHITDKLYILGRMGTM